ncbi:hypothetical protein NDU88_004674 [Pleurodeles waltl]|uniref:Uncharacterized protein n=1 Tax=Pleurodeles waltl TaxID=8319 RepID=A0AAV7SJK2_PLEWA|nr:hypothetical protein NDU88_004674 [Pleurodeles waltl]
MRACQPVLGPHGRRGRKRGDPGPGVTRSPGPSGRSAALIGPRRIGPECWDAEIDGGGRAGRRRIVGLKPLVAHAWPEDGPGPKEKSSGRGVQRGHFLGCTVVRRGAPWAC